MKKCPNCGNENIVGEKYKLVIPNSDLKITKYEFYCGKCGLMESKNNNDPDFSNFYKRWHYPSDQYMSPNE